MYSLNFLFAAILFFSQRVFCDDVEVKAFPTGSLSPGFALISDDDDKKGGVCLRLDRSFELSKLETQECNIPDANIVANSVRSLAGAGWTVLKTSDDAATLVNQNSAVTGASSLSLNVVGDDDAVMYTLTLDGYNFVNSNTSNFYVLEISFGVCGNSALQTSVKLTDKNSNDDSKKVAAAAGATTTKATDSPDTSTTGSPSSQNSTSPSNSNSTSMSNSTSNSNSTDSSDSKTSVDSSNNSTSADSKTSKTSMTSSDSKDSNDTKTTSSKKTSASKDSKTSSEAVESKATASTLEAIRFFMKSTKTTMVCTRNGQTVRTQITNVLCMAQSLAKYRVIVQNFQGCKIVQQPNQSLNVKKILSNELDSEDSAPNAMKWMVSVVVAALAVFYL